MDRNNCITTTSKSSTYTDELHHQLAEYQKAVHAAEDTIMATINEIIEDYDLDDWVILLNLRRLVMRAFKETSEALLNNRPTNFSNCAKAPGGE